jgi:hypothetical protein
MSSSNGTCEAQDIRKALRIVEAEVAILIALDPDDQAARAELEAILRQLRGE